MPRGSKPGTKRGGRKRGTPNRRTILADRIFVAAAAHPVAGWQELLSVLMDDQALPADTRLVIAQKSRSAAARSNKARAKTTNAKSAATSSQKQAAVELDSLFRLARNASLTEEERRKAAALMARVLLPATPTGDPSWSRAVADEYGFVISPKIASEYRDAKLLLQKLKDGNGSIRPGNVRQADKARARLAAIRRSLEPPPHSKYGKYRRHRSDQPVGQDQFQQDLRRLFELEHKRRSKIGLSEEEVAEEAHRMARVDTLICGVEAEAKKRLANLETQASFAARNRRRLRPRATKDLRLLRLLYRMPSTFARIRNRRLIIRSAMRSPPMTATSIRTTQNDGRLPSGLMKTASRSPTTPRSSIATPTIGPIPRKGHRRLCRHNRRPIRRPGKDLQNGPLTSL